MDPLSGLLVAAGVAGVTRAFSANTDRIVAAFQEKVPQTQTDILNRVVITERPLYDKSAAAGMTLDK